MIQNNDKIKRYSFVIIILSALSVTMQIAANLVSARLMLIGPIFGLGPFGAPLGCFFFPFVYIISDITSDVYGYRASRWIAWITVLAQLLLVGIIQAILHLTISPDFTLELNNALLTVFSSSIWIIIGGVFGALIGGWFNDIVFQIFRHKDGESKFIKRKVLSSAAAEAVDTLLFITIAFKIGLNMPWNVVVPMYIIQFILKYGVEIITAPIAKFFTVRLRNYEGSEVFEDRNKFDIFGFEKKGDK